MNARKMSALMHSRVVIPTIGAAVPGLSPIHSHPSTGAGLRETPVIPRVHRTYHYYSDISFTFF
ncbi:hypothetical protein MDUV_42670 [Mycolicibacterium duvalii]|uniref:Uncharacterized protein n=1 Tax=Mycolicibacterium duvalii TaxID=39688 RepID=A0A7I7K5R1_9MYCO|nr:hypothetical protein MDUV_42670 [Mycolicibacterium duvalii]